MATPWEMLSGTKVAASLVALPLRAVPDPGWSLDQVEANQASLAPAVPDWPDAPDVDPSGTWLTREVRVVFGPLSGGQSSVMVAGLALVDMSTTPELLAVVAFPSAFLLQDADTVMNLSATVVATR